MGRYRPGLAVPGVTLVALQPTGCVVRKPFPSVGLSEWRSVQEKPKQVASTRVGTLAVRCSYSRRVPGPPG